MAHIANRSRFRVTVKNKPDLTQHFSFSKVAAVEAYMKELRAQGYKPRAEQLDESWLVRIRERGHKPLEATFETEAAATQFIEKTSEERKRGLFIDYTAALKVTFADILVRYLLEETSRKKSGEVLAYVLEGWLEDSGPRGVELLAQYREELRARGRKVRQPKFKMRQPSTELAWIHKRLAEVTTVDIEGFIDERLEVVAKGTVDREIDRLKAIFKVALKVWDYNLAKNPMDAVRRPDFFNERDRRISADEERRLLEALAQLDLERAVQPVLRELADLAMHVHAFLSTCMRPGRCLTIGLDTLAARVWPTDHDTAPAGTKRRRRCQLRSALDAIGRLEHWDVHWEAGVGGAHKAVIRRSEGRGVRDMTQPAEASALVRVRGSADLPVPTRCARPSAHDVCSLFRT